MCIFSLCQFSVFTKLYTGTCILGMSIVNMYILSMGRVHIFKKYFLVGVKHSVNSVEQNVNWLVLNWLDRSSYQ